MICPTLKKFYKGFYFFYNPLIYSGNFVEVIAGEQANIQELKIK